MPELNLLLIALGVSAAGLLVLWLVAGVRYYRQYRGKRLVVCPENKHTEAVDVAAMRGAVRALVQPEELRLSNCSRWPEKQDCGQDCLRQIEAAPEDCLVWNVVSRWYQGQECVYCHKPFGQLEWHEHRPALLDAERRTVQWDQVAPEKLPDILATHWPVCWNCHTTETFRREHPELVTDRPMKTAS